MKKRSSTIRNLSGLIGASLVLAPPGVFALGVGQIEVYSALNQPLDAEIELHSATPDELATLSVDLASPRVFAQAGVDRLALLSGLEFSVRADARGHSIVKVSSKMPIREPVLDFLVELDWSQGRLVREFVVLLEPPGFAATRRPQAPARSARAPEPAPVETPPPPSPGGGEIYGPVARGETLWGIASRMRPDASIGMQEMMQALLRANPHAFVNNDINKLLAGATLRIPEYQEITGRPAPEGLAARPPEPPPATTPPSASGEQPSLRLESPELVEGAAQPALAAPGMESTPSASSESAVPTFQDSFRIKLKNDHLQLRIADLDELRNRINSLVGVDDAALAAVQGGEEASAEQPEAMSSPAPVGVEPVSPQAVGDESSELPSGSQEPAAPESGAPVAAEAEPTPSTPAVAKTAEPEGFEEAPVEKGTPDQGIDIVGLLLSLSKDPVMLFGGGAGLVLLIALIVLLVRRKKKPSAEEEVESRDAGFERIVAESQPSPAVAAAEAAGLRVSPAPAKKKPEDKTASATTSLERVDLLLAVGNYREAENIVRMALAEDPTNIALALKLLDIHYATGNAQGFVEEAEMLHDRLEGQSDSRWQHVLNMGRELCPGHAMFAEPGKAAAKPQDQPASASVVELHKPRVAETKSGKVDIGKNLPKEQVSEVTPGVKQSEKAPAGKEEDLVIDPFADLDWETSVQQKKQATPRKPEEKPAKAGAEKDEFDLDLESLDFSFDEKLPEPKADTAKTAPESKAYNPAAELKDLSFDFEEVPVAEHKPEELELPPLDSSQAGAAEPGETAEDYVETKLDLAVAYIDMDDAVGARSLLEEVLQEGNADQKKRAQDLLATLS